MPTGSANTASGYSVLYNNMTGIRNTAVGHSALLHSTGNKNIAIGFNAGLNLTPGHNNIYIGSQGETGSEVQAISIGTAQTQTFMAGINSTGVSGTAVVVNANGQPRDHRFLGPLQAGHRADREAGAGRCSDLRPIGRDGLRPGLIAQQPTLDANYMTLS